MKETGFLIKFSLWKMAHFGLKNCVPHNSGAAGRIVFKFCTMKEANGWLRMILIIFKKNFVWDKWTILCQKLARPHNSGSAVRIF